MTADELSPDGEERLIGEMLRERVGIDRRAQGFGAVSTSLRSVVTVCAAEACLFLGVVGQSRSAARAASRDGRPVRPIPVQRVSLGRS